MAHPSFEPIINARQAQLERLKPFISLKSYDALAKKLTTERAMVHGETIRAEQAMEKRERPQSLPKTLFTQRHLPRKAIRID